MANKTLKTDVELLAAALHQQKISAYMIKGVEYPELLEPNGIVEKFTPIAVKVNGAYYTRYGCEFRV